MNLRLFGKLKPCLCVIPASLMFMELPTIHQLTTTLTLQPTRANECRFTLYTGSIAGHICDPAGGGEDGVVPSSPTALLQLLRRRGASLSHRRYGGHRGGLRSPVSEPDLRIRRRRV